MLPYAKIIILVVFTTRCTAQLLLLDESANQEWEAFKTLYGKTYGNLVEELYRKDIFLENLLKISLHNSDLENTFSLRMNFFGDYLPEEISRVRTGLKVQENITHIDPGVPPINVPDSLDWTELGYVTPMKDQGQCASSWAFAVTGVLEGQMFRKTGQLISFSEQNLIDCSRGFGNNGCEGGFPDSAYNYININGGINTEASYPYEAKVGTCRYAPENIADFIMSVDYRNAVNVTEEYLKILLTTKGPISVGMSISESFNFYGGGLYFNVNSSTQIRQLDHAVLAVGYGTENGVNYWKIKNSWGSDWGEGGYVRVRMQTNNSEITSEVTYADFQ